MKALLTSLVLLHAFGVKTSADVCVYKAPEVSAVHGRVIADEKTPDDPVPQANIKLLEYRGGAWVTRAEVVTGDDGRFSFSGVRHGVYHLRVSAFALRTIEAEVRVEGSPPKGKIGPEIIVGLGHSGCGNVFVREVLSPK